jgi:hypothetical protein
MNKLFTLILLLSLACAARAGSTINNNDPYAYAANLGWVNWYGDGTDDGAAIGNHFCSGYIYSANTGWISLGNGSPVNGTSYSQIAPDVGLNLEAGGRLVGYAWGANIGWINFGNNYPASFPSADLPAVSLNPATPGQLTGYAWSANCGWIDLSSGYGAVTYGALSITSNPSMIELTFDGIPGATYLIQYAAHVTGPWANLTGDLVAPSPGGIIQLNYPIISGDPSLFFRVVHVSGP